MKRFYFFTAIGFFFLLAFALYIGSSGENIETGTDPLRVSEPPATSKGAPESPPRPAMPAVAEKSESSPAPSPGPQASEASPRPVVPDRTVAGTTSVDSGPGGIFDLSAPMRVGDRLARIKQRGPSFSQEEYDTVKKWILEGAAPLARGDSVRHWAVNELFASLRHNSGRADETAAFSASVAADLALEEVVRDYALQSLLIQRESGGLADEAVVDDTIARLKENGIEERTSLAGTALLHEARLRRTENVDADTVWSSDVARVAFDPSAETRLRITAMSLIADLDDPRHLRLIADTAADTAEPHALRIAAIHSLGRRSPGDPLLRILAVSDDPRVSYAANSALDPDTVLSYRSDLSE